jgi:hypothetical protein
VWQRANGKDWLDAGKGDIHKRSGEDLLFSIGRIVGTFQLAALAWEKVIDLADQVEPPFGIPFHSGLGAKLLPKFGLFLHESSRRGT